MRRRTEILDRRFGRLKVVSYTGTNEHGYAMWNCVCDFGKLVNVKGRDLNKGDTKSCGCLNIYRLKTHGLSDTDEYRTFSRAKTRCVSPSNPNYADYGGRGIKFLYKDIQEFIADVGYRPSNLHSLDRINNDGNYEPGNCRWATAAEQNANQRPRKRIDQMLTEQLLNGIIQRSEGIVT